MDVSHILDELNDAQRQAVSAPPGGMLVLAGAVAGLAFGGLVVLVLEYLDR